MQATTLAAATAPDPLPQFDNQQSWFGPDLQQRDDWIVELTPAQVAAIDAAVRQAEAVEDVINIGREDFPVPSLEPLLQRVREETLRGRGFMLLRGIPVARYTLRQSAIAYWGLGLYLGEAVSQKRPGPCARARHQPGARLCRPGGARLPDQRAPQLPRRLFGPGGAALPTYFQSRRAVVDRQFDHAMERNGAHPGPTMRARCWRRCITPAGARYPKASKRMPRSTCSRRAKDA